MGFIKTTQSQLAPQYSNSLIRFPSLTWVVNKYTYNDVQYSEEVLFHLISLQKLLEKLFLNHRKDPRDIEIIKTVKNNFSLKSFFIVPAVENSTLWRVLDTIPEEELDKKYVSQMEDLKAYLLNTKPHSYFSQLLPFSGGCTLFSFILLALAVFLPDYLQYANEGKGALTENLFVLIQKESKKKFQLKNYYLQFDK